MVDFGKIWGKAALGLYAIPRTLLLRPARRTAAERLADIPLGDAPLDRPVDIHWDDHQVPFVEAETDRDFACALGVVHAHLRLAQMDIMRRLAAGRIAELVGPAALDLDHSLRVLGVGRAVPEMLAGMPAETRAWLDGFVDGVNHVIARAPAPPYEHRMLAFRPEPWTAADVLTVSRLTAADVTWIVWFSLLRLRRDPDWPHLWRRILHGTIAGLGAFDHEEQPSDTLEEALRALIRGGSNCIAIGADRAANGHAMIASDPHLGINLPNVWLLAGGKSPSFHVVGMMLPGLPVFGLGRTPHIAWGGTNLHAAGSDLFDVSDLDPDAFEERVEEIPVRWAGMRRVRYRESPVGPVMTDAPLLHSLSDGPLAMRWIGHLPSDELSAMLGLMRAASVAEAEAAMERFALPGLTFLYADAEGRIGRSIAARAPRRPRTPPPDLVLPRAAAAAWDETLWGPDLGAPAIADHGVFVSANDEPGRTVAPVGVFFSPPDRRRRMEALLEGGKVTVDRLKALQRDVQWPRMTGLRDRLCSILAECPGDHARRLRAMLQDWDGGYETESAGALAFEAALNCLIDALYHEPARRAYLSTWRQRNLIADDLAALDTAVAARAMSAAVAPALAYVDRHRRWGAVHRLRLGHPLARLPLLGRRFRHVDVGVAGAGDTVMKTAYRWTGGVHNVMFGSCARHISDMADPDENLFALIGGQDGWLGSTTLLDQVPMWLEGRYIRLPLRVDTVRNTFPHRIRLTPTASP